MNRITYFSKHALKRLDQRSILTFYELAKILDCRVFVEIGSEPGFNREHRLFYSVKDKSYYVAIQDAHTGSVVTVLPPDYHQNICWPVKEEEFSAAKNIALNPPKEYEDYENIESANTEPSSTFIVAVHFNDTEGMQKTKEALKIGALPYNRDISALLNDISLEYEIKHALVKKGIKSDSVWSISIRLGKKGERVYFDWLDSALA